MNERIKKVRKILDLTQQEFGMQIGSTQNAITGYESGRRNPSSSVINNICKTFNINETWLRTGEGEMFAPASNTELDALANKYQLSRGAYILVEKFLDLKPEIQEVFVNYAIEVAQAFAANDIPVVSSPSPSTTLDIDAEVAAYRRELELQAKDQVIPSALRNIKEA